MKKNIPGLILTFLLAAAAVSLARGSSSLNAICLAIVAGLIWGNLCDGRWATQPGLHFTEERLLPTAIALMGLELNLQALKETGISAPLIVFPAMFLSITTAVLMGRLLKLPLKSALLTGIGNSVCGSSAILAAAPAMQSKKEARGLSVAAVNLMGTGGIFLLPAIAHLAGFNVHQTATLLGGTLQAVGQVAASASTLSEEIARQALLIKMIRVLMIGPIVLLLTHLFKEKGTERKPLWKYIPTYMIGFAACSILGSLFHNDVHILPRATATGQFLLAMGMVAVGSQMQLKTLINQGTRTLIVALSSSVVLVTATLVLCSLLT